MDYAQLRNRVSLWPHMHFTGALCEVRGGLYEVYATDTSHRHISRIFLVSLTDANEAGEMCSQVRNWLERINRGRDPGEQVVLPAGAAHHAGRLRAVPEDQTSRDEACARECICGAYRQHSKKITGSQLA